MRSKFKWIFTLLVAFTMQFSFAQEKTVTGVVSDAGGTLPGANIVVKGTTRSTQTDVDGKFSIVASPGEVLIITFVGMADTNVTVGAANSINVTLDRGIVLIDVIVEGYRSTTKTTTVVAQQTVNSKTIENRPNASFVQTLQGQVAGVNIQTGTGQPGAKSTVIIRGVGTLNGNSDPLYVIDGIPTQADNFRSLNPDDIASLTVLKDAAATAIYGNRGTNGVIVITTKRGSFEDGKMRIRYAMSTGVTQLQRAKYSFADARELLTIERNAGVGRGNFNPATGLPFTDAEIAAYSVNTDWVDYFFRDASSVTHQLSIENPGKNVNSFTSASYTDQQGVLNTTGLQRFTLRNNLSGKSKNERFTYDTSLSLGFSKNNEATNLGTGAINRNYVLGATLSAPYVSPDEYQNSAQLLELYGDDGTLLYTPLFLIDKLNTYTNSTDELRILGSVDLNYEVFKGFKLRSRTSIDFLHTRFTQSEHPLSFNALLFVDPAAEFGGFEDVNNRREYRFAQLWQAAYNKVIADKHTFGLYLNNEYNFTQAQTINVRQNGLNPVTFVPDTGSGWLPDIDAHDFYGTQSGSGKVKYNLISYFATLDYDFDKRYGISGTVRRDGSSKFLDDYKWGTFYSVGGRWNIDNEKFMENVAFVNVLKLRASYGITGNQRVIDGTEWAGINPPLNRDTYGLNPASYNGQIGNTFTLGYDELRWETTEQTNVGIDFEGFKGRLRTSVDWYKRITTDLFNAQAVSPITGELFIQRNTDTEMHNTGWEVNFGYDLVKTADFTFTVRANWAYNDNRVENVYQGSQSTFNTITQNGGMSYEFFLIPYAGVNPDNGNLLFEAADGTLTENPALVTDQRATGKNANGVYNGGFGFDLDYKGFFATTNFSYVGRAYRLDYDLSGLYDSTSATLGQFTVTDDLLNAWTTPGQITDVPALGATNLAFASDASDRFLVDASYIRLRYAQVGYRVPTKFLDKTFMSALSFYVQGENIYTWSDWQGFDAESNRGSDQAQYPTPRIWSLGMDLRF